MFVLSKAFGGRVPLRTFSYPVFVKHRFALCWASHLTEEFAGSEGEHTAGFSEATMRFSKEEEPLE